MLFILGIPLGGITTFKPLFFFFFFYQLALTGVEGSLRKDEMIQMELF